MILIADWQNYVQHFGQIGVFLTMFIENLGLPFPTEIGFLVAASQIKAGIINYPTAILIITTGHISGAVVAYLIGRFGDQKMSRKINQNTRWHLVHQKLISWYEKWGSQTVLATRLIGYVRPWSSYIAGFARTPFVPFLLWTCVGSLIFSIISLFLSQYLIIFWQAYPELRLETIIVILVLFFGGLTIHLIKSAYEKITHH